MQYRFFSNQQRLFFHRKVKLVLRRCENDALVIAAKFINNGIIIVNSINLQLNSITKYILYWYLSR